MPHKFQKLLLFYGYGRMFEAFRKNNRKNFENCTIYKS